MGILKFIIKFIWEFPSNIVALLLMFFLGIDSMQFVKQRGIIISKMSYQGGLTLGNFVFVENFAAPLVKHEFGHIRQGWALGPLYLLVIGLPSLIWCLIYKSTGKPYEWFYTEHWLMG